jgi:hypothetical protein
MKVALCTKQLMKLMTTSMDFFLLLVQPRSLLPLMLATGLSLRTRSCVQVGVAIALQTALRWDWQSV